MAALRAAAATTTTTSPGGIAPLVACLCLGLLARSASGHEGPPFPVLVDEAAPPWTVSVWADPDVGVGRFWIQLEGDATPSDTRVEVHVAPADGTTAETSWQAAPEPWDLGLQFLAEVDFPTREFWTVRLVVTSDDAGARVERVLRVEVTPPGYGPVDLLLYLWPFLAVAALWIKALSRRRRTPPTPGAPVAPPTPITRRPLT